MQDPVYAQITEKKRPSLFAASGLLLLACAGLWLSSLLELALPEGGGVLLNAAYYLPFIALPLLLYARRHPGLSDALRLNPPPLGWTVALALLALLSVFVASALSALWAGMLDALGLRSPGALAAPASERDLAIAIISMAALPAVCEELLFRGFALSAWETRGTWYAIGVTSALFALLHGNLYGLPNYLLVGAVAGYATWALDSVYAGIVYHTVYNAACLVIAHLLAGEGDAEVALDLAMVVNIALRAAMQILTMLLLLALLAQRARHANIASIPRIRRPLSPRERAMLWAAVGAMVASTAIVAALATLI